MYGIVFLGNYVYSRREGSEVVKKRRGLMLRGEVRSLSSPAWFGVVVGDSSRACGPGRYPRGTKVR